MPFDIHQECASILDAMPDEPPVQEEGFSRQLDKFRKEVAEFAASKQAEYPALTGKKIGGADRMYVYDPCKVLYTLEEDVVRHWIKNPESLSLTFAEMAQVVSSWYDQPVSADRIKRRWTDKDKTRDLQKLVYDLENSTDISKCRSLAEVHKRLLTAYHRTADRWSFRGDITFYSNGSVEINRQLASTDKTASGKDRIRGNGKAVPVDALRDVPQAYSGANADRSDPRTAYILKDLDGQPDWLVREP